MRHDCDKQHRLPLSPMSIRMDFLGIADDDICIAGRNADSNTRCCRSNTPGLRLHDEMTNFVLRTDYQFDENGRVGIDFPVVQTHR